MATKRNLQKLKKTTRYLLQQLFIVGTVGSFFLFVPLHRAHLSSTREAASAAKRHKATRMEDGTKIVWLDKATSQGPGEKN